MKSKRSVLFALILFGATFANGQILKNSLLIGGTGNFDYSSGRSKVTINGQTNTTTTPKDISFGIEPRFGYFFAKNFALGLNLDFRIKTSSQEINKVNQTQTSTTLLTGPFARYYFGLSHKIFAFGECSFGGGVDAHSQYNPATNQNENLSVTNLQVGIGPGIDFFIDDFVAFEGLAKYTYNNNTFTAIGQTNNTNLNNIHFVLGLQVYLRALEGGLQ